MIHDNDICRNRFKWRSRKHQYPNWSALSFPILSSISGDDQRAIIRTCVKWSWLSAELAVITICIKAERGVRVALGGGEGAKRFSHVRALSLRGGERVSEKREGHANRRLHVCLSSLPFLSPAGASRARCFLIPWPNSLSRGETLIDIPLLRFERGISVEPEITFHSDTDHTFHTFSGVDRVPRNMGGEVDRWSRCRTIVGPFIFSKILKFSCRRMQGGKN